MFEASVRSLRTTERFLINPPLTAEFGAAPVSLCDISMKGARIRHRQTLEMGNKAVLRLSVANRPNPVTIEAVVMWTQRESVDPPLFVSGVRTYASIDLISGVLRALQNARRTTRIEELRGADRFFVSPTLDARWEKERVHIEDVSARGVRIETSAKLNTGAAGMLHFSVPGESVKAEVKARVVWSTLKAVDPTKHRAGLVIGEKGEMVRLAIGHLCESGRASIDTHSLALKVKIIRARARQLAPSYRDIETSGIPAEQYILVQSVREELRLNPQEAMHWYRRARILIQDPQTRAAAPAIADHPDALAVWEYLDRSIDPSIIGRTFQLPPPEH
jgi:Tfp pilus assembly protein PilZ